MKIFLANSVLSYISRIFVYFPIVVAIILSINNSNLLVVFIVIGSLMSYLLYNCNFCWYLGFLKFTNEFIYTPNDFVSKITRLQYKEKIYYKDICAIEFRDIDGNSNGESLWKASCISYIEITTNDNFLHRIAIGKYSHKQWKNIEKEFTERVPDLLILKNADELIKFRKY